MNKHFKAMKASVRSATEMRRIATIALEKGLLRKP